MDFKIYKPVREDAMSQLGVSNEAEFAVAFAGLIARATGCAITGTYEEECVSLHTSDENMQAVCDTLDKRGLSYRF